MASAPAAPLESKKSPSQWKQLTAPYCGPDTQKSLLQLSTTFGMFVLLWTAMYWSLEIHYALTLLLSLPTAGFLVRLFMIQHDCGHGSYFKQRWARDWVGFCIGVLTLTPYQYWRQSHAYHHSHSGDLDYRGFGDIETLTVKEYLARSKWDRLRYRLFRNPLVLLVIGPAFHFIIKHRYPWGIPAKWKEAWRSVWKTNAAILGIILLMGFTMGFGKFIMIQAPITLLASSIGVWLFYVQHQFEYTYWHHHEDWNYFDAAVHGSSHLVLPTPLQWLTANIGIHHIHHMDSQIPNYKLEECLRSNPDFQSAHKITIADTWKLFRLTLWDEDNQVLIRFKDLRSRA